MVGLDGGVGEGNRGGERIAREMDTNIVTS